MKGPCGYIQLEWGTGDCDNGGFNDYIDRGEVERWGYWRGEVLICEELIDGMDGWMGW